MLQPSEMTVIHRQWPSWDCVSVEMIQCSLSLLLGEGIMHIPDDREVRTHCRAGERIQLFN